MERESSVERITEKQKVYELTQAEHDALVNGDVSSLEFQRIKQENGIEFSDHIFFRVDGGDVRVATGTENDFCTAIADGELRQSLLKQVE